MESLEISISIFNYYYISIYLVDPASSHILVLKIKPCMSQFFDWYTIDCEWFSITVSIFLNNFLCG